MKRILLIATGGTIASTEDGNGLSPALTGEELAQSVPEISGLCELDVVQPMNIDSTNMRPSDWMQIRDVIVEGYADHDGFVILHGTDTMSYTAAALSYLIQDSPKPIVLTGAQKPIWFDGTDSKRNLTDAFLYACRGCGGVQIVFNGKVILGTRARKTCSKSFQAFSSVNYPDLAVLQDERLLQYIRTESLPRPVFYDKLCENVGLLKLIPGTKPELVEFMTQHYDGLIIESFGVGGLPCYEQADFLSAAAAWSSAGKPIVITTQVPHEGSDLAVYQVGARAAAQPGILQAYTMTVEAVVTKLMWILPQTRDLTEIKRLFYAPIACDLLQFEERGQEIDESH